MSTSGRSISATKGDSIEDTLEMAFISDWVFCGLDSFGFDMVVEFGYELCLDTVECSVEVVGFSERVSDLVVDSTGEFCCSVL